MILQSLHAYYLRLLEDPDTAIAPPGFQHIGFSHAIVLKPNGRFSHFLTLSQGKEQKRMLVPQAVKKTSGVASNLLWENPSYIFGIPKKDSEKDRERASRQQEAFLARIRDLFGDKTGLPEIQAIMTFMESDPRSQAEQDPLWEEVKEAGRNLCFMIEGSEGAVTDQPSVKAVVKNVMGSSLDASEGQCLVTGQTGPVTPLHPSIKNVWGAQPAGANIVSFNADAFSSYGLDSGENAPVSEEVAFAYTTVLNHMLRKGSAQRMQVGDASTVFWTDAPDDSFISEFSLLLSGPPKSAKKEIEEEVMPVRKLLAAIHSGVLPEEDEHRHFYVLGLAPNAARISIRFWHQGSINEIRRKLAQHFSDIEMTGRPGNSPHPRLYFLLRSTALLSKAENVLPNLGGDVFRSVLSGTPYPRAFMQQALLRARAEQDVTQERAAIFKACINRSIRHGNLNQKELMMSLDKTNETSAYVAGRLFAVLERAQHEAYGESSKKDDKKAGRKLNASIVDKYYSSASSGPGRVLGTLISNNQNHLKLLDRDKPHWAWRVRTELEEIFSKISSSGLPTYLPAEDQCRFAVGYYHQKQEFYKPWNTANNPENKEQPHE